MSRFESAAKNLLLFYILLGLAVAANIAVWSYSHQRQPIWANIPPAPSSFGAMTSFLGDRALAYRVSGFLLQNFGNTSGEGVKPLSAYNFKNLHDWFMLLDQMDSRSNYMPFLAAYYFGGTQDSNQLSYVVDYLALAGEHEGEENWRWLAQAVFLARHGEHKMEKALHLSRRLAAVYRPGMPAWTKQMEAIITSDMGDKETAYRLMRSILMDGADKLHPNEVNYMRSYICEQILTSEQALEDPICAE